jgi:hypothetical protein
MGWLPALGSANTAYPLQTGLALQGGSALQQQQQLQGGFGHPQAEFFPGGFLRVDTTNIASNATATSASPTSLTGTGSSSAASHPQPNGFAQRPPPVVPPNVEKGEYVRVSALSASIVYLFPRGAVIFGS